jgi:hypothetical protein
MADDAARLVLHVDQALAQMEQNARKFVTAAGIVYTNEVKRLMRTSPRGGRIYRRLRVTGLRNRLRGRGARAGDYITHRASAPGEPPAVDRGNLINSVASVEELTPKGWATTGGSTLATIPTALEYGTGTIAPRPAFIPALMNIKAQLEAALIQAFKA